MNWEKAPVLFVSSHHLYGIRSEWYVALFKVVYLPVCRYPPEVEILLGEDGALLKLNKALKPHKVLRRIIVAGRGK